MSAVGDRINRAAATAPAREALAGTPAWIVGGAVRDALLGREVVDLDLAIDGDPRAAARSVADAAGGFAFELSNEFGTWRAVGPDRAWHVDVAPLRGGSIEADLGMRDLTVNALATELADPAATLDPTGGARDAEVRVLRAVSSRSFVDDPLRILRTARLAALLAFEPEPGTVGLARESADRAAEPAGERQFAELRMILTGPAPVRGLELLDQLGAEAVVLPELAALRGVAQNPNHHLDVHGHTIAVLEHLLEVEADLDRYAGESAPAVRELLAEPLADEVTRGGALRFAAVLHDVGKPATRQEHEGGFVSFVGHDSEGATLVRGACERLRTSRAFAQQLEALTRHHLHLGFMVRERPLSRARLYEYLRLTEPVAADVSLLTVADRLSARGSGPTASPEMIEAHLALVREVLPDAIAWHRDGPPRSPIAGDELAAELGIVPGPELGELLGVVEAGVFEGEVRTRDDAVARARAARVK